MRARGQRLHHQKGEHEKRCDGNGENRRRAPWAPERTRLAPRPDHGRLELVGRREQAGERGAGAFGGGPERNEVGLDLIKRAGLAHATMATPAR